MQTLQQIYNQVHINKKTIIILFQLEINIYLMSFEQLTDPG